MAHLDEENIREYETQLLQFEYLQSVVEGALSDLTDLQHSIIGPLATDVEELAGKIDDVLQSTGSFEEIATKWQDEIREYHSAPADPEILSDAEKAKQEFLEHMKWEFIERMKGEIIDEFADDDDDDDDEDDFGDDYEDYDDKGTDELDDQIDELEMIQAEFFELIDRLKTLNNSIKSSELSHYIIPHIECSVTSEHEWLDRSANLQQVLDSLKEKRDDRD